MGLGLLLLQIGMLIVGLIALVRGRFPLSKTRIVAGVAARLAGLALMLPLILTLLIGFRAVRHPVVEITITVICSLCAVLVGVFFGKTAVAEGNPVAKATPKPESGPVLAPAERNEGEGGREVLPVELSEHLFAELPAQKATVAASEPMPVADLSRFDLRTLQAREPRNTYPFVLALAMLLLGIGLGSLGWFLDKPRDEVKVEDVKQQADERVDVREMEIEAAFEKRLNDLQRVIDKQNVHVEELQRRANDEAQLARVQRLRAQTLEYAAQLNGAMRDWGDDDVQRSLRLLQGCPEKLRSWEYHYVRQQLEGGRWTRRCKNSALPPMAVMFHPDGKRLVTVYQSGLVQLWDTQTGEEIEALSSPPPLNAHAVQANMRDSIGSAALRPDGRQLALGYKLRKDGSEIVLRDVGGKGDRKRAFHAHQNEYLAGLAYSPDGTRLASATLWHTSPFRTVQGDVKIWNVETGRELLSLAGCNCVAFHPDGKQLVTARPGGRIGIWDAGDGKELVGWKAHGDNIRRVQYSPDGKRIVSMSEDGTTQIWEAATGREAFPFHNVRSAVAFPRDDACFSPDGRYLAVTSSVLLRLCDARTGAELYRLRGNLVQITALAFSPDSKHLASAGSLTPDGTTTTVPGLKLWGVPREGPSPLREVYGLPHPDGEHLLCVAEDAVQLRNLDGSVVRKVLALKPRESAHFLAVSPDGKQFAISHPDKIWTYDLATGRPLKSYEDRVSAIHQLAYSPDSLFLASSGKGVVKVWDTRTGRQTLTLSKPEPMFRSVAFSPDGRYLASILDGGPIVVWDFPSGDQVHLLRWPPKISPPRVSYLAFSPDSKRLGASRGVVPFVDVGVQLWDVETGRAELFVNDRRPIYVFAFSPDGKRLAAAGEDDLVRIWDLAHGLEVFALKGPRNAFAMKFGTGGRRLVLCGLAGHGADAITIWDADPAP